MTRFEIQDMAYQNQHGVTFRALDTETNQIVSLRRFFPFGIGEEDEEGGEGLDPQEAKAFSSACQRLSKVHHPALRKTIFGGTDPVDGMPFLVTEWIDGESLASVLGNNTMEPSMIIELVHQALEVCILLSDTLVNEAVWIDTNIEAIIVSNPNEKPNFSFRICPFKWLGTQHNGKDLTGIVGLVETLMGWKTKLVSDQAGLGLGGWLKLLRQNPQMNLKDALQSLPNPAAEILFEDTENTNPLPVQQPYILASADSSFFTKKSIAVMALSACFTGALIFFLYQQNAKKIDMATTIPMDENAIVEYPPKTPEISQITETTPELTETSTPKIETSSPNTNLWTPAEISTEVWYDASDSGSIISSEGLVSQWKDRSGNSKHATQSTGDFQPMTGKRNINGLNTLDFSTDKLSMADVDMAGKAMFAVVQRDTSSYSQIFSNSSINVQLRLNTEEKLQYSASPPLYLGDTSSTNELRLNTPGMVGYIFDTTMRYSVNGVFEDTGIAFGTGNSIYNQIGIRADNGEEAWDGLMGEIIVTSSIPDSDTRQKIEGYLAHKWGLTGDLPENHPYKSSAPPATSKIETTPEITETSTPKTEPSSPNTNLWTPAEILTAAWYDASDTETITASEGLVSQWKDKSGNNRHIDQTLPESRPTYSENTVSFDGIDDYLSNKKAFMYENGLIDIYFVASVSGQALDKRLLSEVNSESSPPFYAPVQTEKSTDSSMMSAYVRGDDKIIIFNNTTSLSKTGAFDRAIRKLYHTRDTGKQFSTRVNSGPVTTVKYTRSGTIELNSFAMGAVTPRLDQPASSFLEAQVNEIIITPSLLDDAHRKKTEGYLAHKWGLAGDLPANHPYKSSAPASSSKPETLVSLPTEETTTPELETTPPPTNTTSPNTKLWSPAEVSPVAWYDAADTNTITATSGAVSEWRDKSGNDNHLTQGTGSAQPGTGTRTVNGINVIDFDGADFIQKNAFPVPASGDVAIFMVAVIDVIDSRWDSLYSMAATADFQFDAAHGSQFNGRIRTEVIGAQATATGGSFAGPSIFNTNFDKTIDGVFNQFIDGTQRIVNTTYTRKLDSSQTFRVFGNRNAAELPDGAVGEVIIVEDVSDATRQKIEGYLAHKWGLAGNLPADHPYKLPAPIPPIPPIPSILTSGDTEAIKTLKVGDPVKLQGIVRSAKLSSTGKSIYLSFSDPVVETDIRVVIHGNEYEGNAFTEEEFAKLIGKNLVFSGTVYRETFNNRPPFVKITEKGQIKLAPPGATVKKVANAESAIPTPTKLETTTGIPVFSPDDVSLVEKLNKNSPVKLQGTLKATQYNHNGDAILLLFSTPYQTGQLRGVAYKKNFKDPYDLKTFDKFIGKEILLDGVFRSINSPNPYIIEIVNLNQISILSK